MGEPPSSPLAAGASTEETLAWYKAQYEQLEQELAEFRDSSRELESELEKDIDAAEKRERVLKEKAESLNYEVDEWKVCATTDAEDTLLLAFACLHASANTCRAEEIPRVQERGEHSAELSREGNHKVAGDDSDRTVQATRYRGRKR